MQLIDTHAHLDDEQFDHCRDAVIERAVAAGVIHIIAIGTTAAASEKCLEIANTYEGVAAAVGIQPNYTAAAGADDWQRIVELAKRPHVVALGETGLDHYWDYAPLDVQQDFFERHLRLSRDTGLPFVVHMRDPKPDTGQSPTACSEHILEVLCMAAKAGPLRGVMHSYSGNSEHAELLLDLGLYISFAGMVTYKKSDELRGVAANIPPDRILIETDAPYLSPQPKRGQRPNESALIVHTAECLAQVRGISTAELAEITTRNAQTLFKIDDRCSQLRA